MLLKKFLIGQVLRFGLICMFISHINSKEDCEEKASDEESSTNEDNENTDSETEDEVAAKVKDTINRTKNVISNHIKTLVDVIEECNDECDDKEKSKEVVDTIRNVVDEVRNYDVAYELKDVNSLGDLKKRYLDVLENLEKEGGLLEKLEADLNNYDGKLVEKVKTVLGCILLDANKEETEKIKNLVENDKNWARNINKPKNQVRRVRKCNGVATVTMAFGMSQLLFYFLV